MEKLKAAVIGLGRMGAEPSVRLEGKIPAGWLPISHAEAIKAIPQLELIAFCDSDEERLARLSKHYNVANVFTSYTRLIDEIRPDFLCIATRTEGRTDIIRYAAAKGVKIIYFEKPASRSIQDCRDAMEIAKENKVVVGYGVNRRYHAQYRKAKEIIRSGLIGELKEVIVEHGTANLYWAHAHSVDLILYFAESTEIEYLQGTCSFTNNYQPTDLNFVDNDPIIENAFFSFKNGIIASINQGVGLNTRLICSKGILTIYSDGSWIEIHKSDDNGYLSKPDTINVSAAKSATVTAFEELIDHVIDGDNLPITPQEIIAGITMLNGLVYSSLSGGSRINTDAIPNGMTITGRTGNYYA